MKKLRILYVGDLMLGGTCLERLKVLEDFGFEVIPISMSIWDMSRVQRSFEHRLLDGPNTRRLNAEIIEKATIISPSVVWIDKGRNVFASTIKKLKNDLGILCVHYTADPAFTVHTSRHFNQAIKFYDLCITNKKYEMEIYKEFGANEVLFNYQGADANRYSNVAAIDSCARRGSIFVGHFEEDYVRTLSWIEDVDPSLQIHGNGWTKGTKKIVNLGEKVCSEGVWANEYPEALASAKIGLGLLCKAYPDQFTTRSFEIPAAGTMLLAERTQEHTEIFVEDVEAVFFNGRQELSEKLSKYLKDDELRSEVARAGQKKVIEEFTWNKVMLPAVQFLESR